MNFKIVEGGDSQETLDRFVDLYNQNIPLLKIAERIGCSEGHCLKIRDKLADEGVIPRYRNPAGYRRNVLRKPRHYTYRKHQKCYSIERLIDKKHTYFTSFKNEKDCIRAVELFNKYGWDKQNVERIRKEVLGK